MPRTSDSLSLTLKFGTLDRKRELVEAAAKEGVPVVHYVWQLYLEHRTREEARHSFDRALGAGPSS